MNMKKLALTEHKKNILIQALRKAADAQDRDMRKIYDDTTGQAMKSDGRILLTPAQVGICKCALMLMNYNSDIEDMLLQLTTTRKGYVTAQQPKAAE